VVSSGLAPVALIGGWTVAANLQPDSFSSVTDTISALAALGARDRWLMTGALIVVGLCHIATAAGLRPAHRIGRAVLAAGGAGTVGVAAFPLDREGQSTAHGVVAFIAFVALAVWPAVAANPQSGTAFGRPRNLLAALVLSLLVLWFFASRGSGHVGLAERLAAGAQSLWPLVVVATSLRSARRAGLTTNT